MIGRRRGPAGRVRASRLRAWVLTRSRRPSAAARGARRAPGGALASAQLRLQGTGRRAALGCQPGRTTPPRARTPLQRRRMPCGLPRRTSTPARLRDDEHNSEHKSSTTSRAALTQSRRAAARQNLCCALRRTYCRRATKKGQTGTRRSSSQTARRRQRPSESGGRLAACGDWPLESRRAGQPRSGGRRTGHPRRPTGGRIGRTGRVGARVM